MKRKSKWSTRGTSASADFGPLVAEVDLLWRYDKQRDQSGFVLRLTVGPGGPLVFTARLLLSEMVNPWHDDKADAEVRRWATKTIREELRRWGK